MKGASRRGASALPLLGRALIAFAVEAGVVVVLAALAWAVASLARAVL